jgi:hypothetical protein
LEQALGFLRHKPTKSALARILDVDRSAWTADSSVSGGGGRSLEAKVRLRVMPDDQPEFDSEARVWGMDAVQQLAPGRDTYVLYDPEHTSRCDIDRERLRNEFGPERNGKDRVVILTAAQAQFEVKLTARDKDPAAYAEHRRNMSDRAAAQQAYAQAIRDAVQAGDFAEVERLRANRATGGPADGPSGPGSVRSGVASPEDPLERLQKLADLHDRGALTDTEFAAEKAKILNES